MVNPYLISMEVSAILASSILVVCFSLALINILRGPKVMFLMKQCILLMISNFFYIVYISLYNTRRRVVSHKSPDMLLVVTICMVCDYIHYVCLFVCMWQFAFKYWVVAVEMPKVIRELDQGLLLDVTQRTLIWKQHERNRVRMEKRYNIVWFIGILINIGMCTWY
jgi:hypothetical protein